MSVFPILEDQAIAREALTTFDEITEKYGSVPIFYRVIAVAPPLVQAYFHSFTKAIMEGVLPSQVKELIFLAVARKRHCVYCTSVHLAICDMFDIDRATIEAVMTEVNTVKPARIAALLTFCLSAMDSPEAVSEQAFVALASLGISNREIIEALYAVSYASGGVFLAKALKVDVDDSVHDYLAENKLSIGFI